MKQKQQQQRTSSKWSALSGRRRRSEARFWYVALYSSSTRAFATSKAACTVHSACRSLPYRFCPRERHVQALKSTISEEKKKKGAGTCWKSEEGSEMGDWQHAMTCLTPPRTKASAIVRALRPVMITTRNFRSRAAITACRSATVVLTALPCASCAQSALDFAKRGDPAKSHLEHDEARTDIGERGRLVDPVEDRVGRIVPQRVPQVVHGGEVVPHADLPLALSQRLHERLHLLAEAIVLRLRYTMNAFVETNDQCGFFKKKKDNESEGVKGETEITGR